MKKFGNFFLAAVATAFFVVTTTTAQDVDVKRLYHRPPADYHYYSIGEDEWNTVKKLNNQFANTGVAFTASAEPLRKTARLFRWRGPDGKLYFGTALPPGAKGFKHNEDWHVYVWPKKSRGLVPVFASCKTDGSDMYFTTSEDEHIQKIKSDWEGSRVRRVNLRVVFYAKEPPGAQAQAQSQP